MKRKILIFKNFEGNIKCWNVKNLVTKKHTILCCCLAQKRSINFINMNNLPSETINLQVIFAEISDIWNWCILQQHSMMYYSITTVSSHALLQIYLRGIVKFTGWIAPFNLIPNTIHHTACYSRSLCLKEGKGNDQLVTHFNVQYSLIILIYVSALNLTICIGLHWEINKIY